MTDHRLSTSDLAARSESESESSRKSDPTADRTTSPIPAGEQTTSFEGAPSDAPLARDPASTQASDARTIDGGANPAVSDHRAGDTRRQDTNSRHDHQPLFANDQSERFTTRWQEIQTSFVDQPREAVAEADTLVADLMQRLAASFSKERERLEAQWDRGDDVSTEDLRVALTRYRSFFDRLLSA